MKTLDGLVAVFDLAGINFPLVSLLLGLQQLWTLGWGRGTTITSWAGPAYKTDSKKLKPLRGQNEPSPMNKTYRALLYFTSQFQKCSQ